MKKGFQAKRWTKIASGLVGSLLAITLVVGYGTDALHFLIVSHSVCADHGEITHGKSDEHSHHTHHASNHGTEVGNAGMAAHSHEHCGLLALQRKRGNGLTRVEAFSIVANEALVTIAPIQERTVFLDLNLLFLAPKTSPPSIG